MRAIYDLERAIHLWELLRDNAQRAANETTAGCEKVGKSVELTPRVARARAFIANCYTSILAAKARIDDLERED